MTTDWEKTIKKNLSAFYTELEHVCRDCGRKQGDIQIVYATKYLDADQFLIFLHICKQFDIKPITVGENRVQDAKQKFFSVKEREPDILKNVKLILIGTLQKNKINAAIEIFSEIHSIDNLDLAKALDMRLGRMDVSMPVFLEVNVSGEKSKHGVNVVELDETIQYIRKMPRLQLTGLMTMAPQSENLEEVRPVFHTLKSLADTYNLQTSMGMSSDWKVALEEGTSMIRIGQGVFRNN